MSGSDVDEEWMDALEQKGNIIPHEEKESTTPRVKTSFLGP